MTKPLAPETIAAQAGGGVDPETGAIIPPIHLSTTYIRDPDNQYRRSYSYSRPDNPLTRQVEDVLRQLEGGERAMVFASGMAAACTAMLALDRPAHVVAPSVMYWGLKKWLADDAPSLGVRTTFVDATSIEAIRAAIVPGETRMVWIETPANPMWGISDIRAAAQAAHAAGALLAVDSTVATPVLTRPIELGADVVMHSATKYLNGHSDVLAGAIVLARGDAYADRLARGRSMLGAVIGPMEASLLLRGMRTLHLRVRHQCVSALSIAGHFAAHPRIEAVLYPGLERDPGHATAARQMSGGFGGMLSVRVKGGETAAIRAAANVKLWKRATSLGGVESLVEHRASVEGPGTPCPPDLLRLSVGIEAVADLIADLEQALIANA
ncbi:MAG: aminotransferase class I/II-fold pyridoxal phosphate-dependent enzyme [Hyphomicrobiaceae bacterium]|nr:aminotransferase class I/II-fold pyridoxal phosphate-dependent enzyme [Hyphomicrobiaceae bacterium]